MNKLLLNKVGLLGALVMMPALGQVLADPGTTQSYRHGLVPMIGSTSEQQADANTVSPKDLHYGGGTAGVGVITGKPRVYLVFWGSQWGTEGSDGNGYVAFTGDPAGLAPALQAFFTGLGTGDELWSGVMTQYCEGVAVGAVKCLSTNTHVGYPLGGALAGVWEDTSVAAPANASAHQIGQEAVKAAQYFGNLTTESNSHDQYFVISPTGTNPDSYKTLGFCAWHDFTGDSQLDGGGAVPGPVVPFTNLPYLPDVGAGCGAGFVNPGNELDGVTIIGGHEYAETITDTWPVEGWINRSQEEAADICAWLKSGTGRAQNLTLTTGTFAVQGIWSNAGATCSVSHKIVR
jgi:hypothetical protein